MPQHISFGELNTIGGFPTIGSRFIDSKALIEHDLQEKKKPIQQIQDKITINDNAIAAYYEMQQLLANLQQSVQPLQTASLYGYGASTVFGSQSIDAQTNNTKSVSYYCNIQSNGNQINNANSFEFQILQIAKPQILQTFKVNSSTANITQLEGDYNNGLFNCGVFQINSVNITVQTGNCLNDIAASINEANANVSASVKQINQQYRLLLESQQTGVIGAMNITDTNNVLNGIFGNLTNINLAPSENMRSPAQDAQLMFVNDVDVYTYSDNLITDFIDGITLQLIRPTNYDSIQLEITPDVEQTFQGMLNFIDAYNRFIDFSASQQKRERCEQGNIRYAEDAYLYHNNGMLYMQNSLYQTISNFQTSNNGDYQSIYNIAGINSPTINLRGDDSLNTVSAYKMQVCLKSLRQYMDNDVTQLQNIMQSSIVSNSTNFSILTSGPFLGLGNFTVNLNATDPTNLQATLYYYDFDAAQMQRVNATFNLNNATDITQGGVIRDANDDVFNNLVIGYSGAGGLDYASFNTTYGLADQLGDTISAALAAQSIVDIGLLDLQSKSEALQSKLAKAQTSYDRNVKQSVNSQTSTVSIEKQNIIIEHLVQQSAAAYGRTA